MGIIITTFKRKWTDAILHMINHWRTSLIGLLSFVAITSGAIAPFITHHKTALGISIFTAAIRAWQGLLMQDPGTTTAVTPDNPVPHAEPSTEIPLNPDAQIVK